MSGTKKQYFIYPCLSIKCGCYKLSNTRVKFMRAGIYRGILRNKNGSVFIEDESGKQLLKNEIIWNGYVQHWTDKKVFARLLPQKDYLKNRPITILWPEEKWPESPFIDLYYNERLVNYPISFLGHIAINVSGKIFNFSHLLSENEILNKEEYFYRPALGEFGPDPVNGGYNTEDIKRPFLDKFGRLFMRSIHVLRITDIKTKNLSDYFHNELKIIQNTPEDIKDPEKYRDFNIFGRSCSTIIRDGLNEAGFSGIKGIFPRDLFISAANNLTDMNKTGGETVSLFKLKQLKVPEAPYSSLSFIINPVNRYRNTKLQYY